MSRYPRYAIYYAPTRHHALYRFGAELLGYDAFSGDGLPFPDAVMARVPDWRDISQEPRAYGFHATLKPPFALAADATEPELLAACERFATIPRPIPSIAPVVDAIGSFIAVVPATPSAELNRLAQDCVEAFDEFRAPLTPEDRARRNPAALTAAQLAHLDRWGYPYVMEEFRFHMTLTGRLPAERRGALLALLRDRLAALALAELAIDRVAVFRQDAAATPFRVIGQFGLR
ncbi:MAG: DUF1045 domain-containing protein [Rhodopseudomonas sp.]|uniref:DUF1045 domain-containing protein n=1 Tax=Rhodopseudomonas sp. TaxID=1078 RepID=UPI001825A602|nr:DUF1045 domain-containing protein [Rhodopseudomonas sp.]NVN85280.1 DUF1045 domain-containing protein [Rhodopseudomonas sp.]